jgi:hypothetical protein
MSCHFVDMPSLGVLIPASFKRIAELRSIHRDATTGDLDIRQYGHAATGRGSILRWVEMRVVGVRALSRIENSHQGILEGLSPPRFPCYAYLNP